MKKTSDGFLLVEVLFSMFILTMGIIVVFESIVWIEMKESQSADYLEMSIFALEMMEELDGELEEYVRYKSESQGIDIIERKERSIILEKNGQRFSIVEQ